MDKQLNIPALKQAATQQGLSQTALANKLNLTKAAVSKWFNGLSFPRPAELLKLGRLLKLSYREIVLHRPDLAEPLIAFRKRGSCITTDKHTAKAKDMGRFLTPLVPYLEFDPFVGPASLKNPNIEYTYLQELAAKLRRDMNLGEADTIDFADIVNCFHEYQAVIIPTLWGEKSRHENALHVHLPKSQTTWIYLNLDCNIHDFKYWMAHEYGHVLTIDLLAEGKTEEAEDFADAFAGALLFPRAAAKKALSVYKRARTDRGRITALFAQAEQHIISPLSVYYELEKYAQASGSPFDKVESSLLHSQIAIFNKSYSPLSEALFDDKQPTADHFMRIAQENFGTDFYKALGAYLKENDAPPKSIACILGVSPMDAHAYHEALAGQ